MTISEVARLEQRIRERFLGKKATKETAMAMLHEYRNGLLALGFDMEDVMTADVELVGANAMLWPPKSLRADVEGHVVHEAEKPAIEPLRRVTEVVADYYEGESTEGLRPDSDAAPGFLPLARELAPVPPGEHVSRLPAPPRGRWRITVEFWPDGARDGGK